MYFCKLFKATQNARIEVVGKTEEEEAKTNTIKEIIQKRKSTFNKTMTNLWFCCIKTV